MNFYDTNSLTFSLINISIILSACSQICPLVSRLLLSKVWFPYGANLPDLTHSISRNIKIIERTVKQNISCLLINRNQNTN